MQFKIKSILLTLLVGLLPTYSFAQLEGLPVASDGGLQVGSPEGDYWFNISGVAKVDSRSYTGNTKTTASGVGGLGTYMSSVFIRDLGINFEGGIGKNFSYTIELDIDANDKQVAVDTAYLSYNGFSNLLPNLEISVGQVVAGFSLNAAESSKWSPFMERAMATNVFGPQAGIGINANTYDNHYSATVAITQQPKSGNSIKNIYGQSIKTNDLWQAATRLTWAPASEAGRIFQVGLSAHIQEYANNGLQFRAPPEMRSRNSTTLLNTTKYYTSSFGPGAYAAGPDGQNQLWIAARNQTTIDFELLGVYGPLSGEVEYQRAYVTRGTVNGAKQGGNLQFSGYHAQAAYILTGEVRTLKKSNGTLGQIKPKNKYGAVEVGVRYSYINLNDKDITGGSSKNTTASISWYLNNNVKLMGEYVLSLQKRQFSAIPTYPAYLDKRTVGGIGLRAQFVF